MFNEFSHFGPRTQVLFRSGKVAGLAVALAVSGMAIAAMVLACVLVCLWVASLFLVTGDTVSLFIYFAALVMFKVACYVIVIVSTVYFVVEIFLYKKIKLPTRTYIVKNAAASTVVIGLAEIASIFPYVVGAEHADADNAFALTCVFYFVSALLAGVFGIIPALVMWFTSVADSTAAPLTDDAV